MYITSSIMHCAILKAIHAGVDFGSGAETNDVMDPYDSGSVQGNLPLHRVTSMGLMITTAPVDPARMPGMVQLHSQTHKHASTRDSEQDWEGLHNLLG